METCDCSAISLSVVASQHVYFAHGVDDVFDHMVERGGIRGHIRKERKPLAAAHDRKPVVAHGTAHKHGIAGTGVVP